MILPMSRRNIFWTLNFLFVIQWTLMAFGVHDRAAWLLENLLLALFVGPIIWLFLKERLSVSSYVMIYIFLALHTVGAHYTYSEVPYNEWTKSLFGASLNEMLGLKRNHYDRFLHFLFGFLLYYPLKETFFSFSKLRGAMLVVVTLLSITTASTIYEMIEWAAAEIFGEGTGMAFLGTQGDVWDAHKDQALAMLGSLLAVPLFNRISHRVKTV